MYHQKSYCIFVALWTTAFAIMGAHGIYKYAGDPLRLFVAGPIAELQPVEWEASGRRPDLKLVVFPVTQQDAVVVPTWKPRPEARPLPKQKLRVDPPGGRALLSDERGWVFGIAKIFIPSRLFVIGVLVSVVTVVLWLPFFSGKSRLDRHRERVRRRRRHKKASRFPLVWTRVVAVLFLCLAPLVAWWAFASVIPSGNLVAGLVLAALAIVHIPVLIGMLRERPAGRTMMMILPWTWMPVVPVGTVLAIVTLAALPHLPELRSGRQGGE